MSVEILEERRVEAEPAEMPVIRDNSDNVSLPDVGVNTVYTLIIFRPPPAPYRGRPVVRQLPADWPYPPEEGY